MKPPSARPLVPLLALSLAACRSAESPPEPEPAPAPDPPGGRTERWLDTATIRVRIDEAGSGPLVLFLHGFPELAYSWRHQLDALAAAGYHAVAPDMRGYGGTEAPEAIEAYDLVELAGDVVALMDALGEERAVLVGNDWGAMVAWTAVVLYPERFTHLIAFSVAYGLRGEKPILDQMRAAAGENFSYVLYFQEPGVAEAELDADPRAVFERFFASHDQAREPAEITDPRADAGGLLGRYGRPLERAAWLTAEDLDHYAETFGRTGFRGGLNYYRNFDRSWARTADVADSVVDVPVLFLAGEHDLVIGGASQEQLEAMMAPVTRDLTVKLIPGAGHWLQQEHPAVVNAAILEFLER